MESDVVENDLDKGDEQLFHYLKLRLTEGSCPCIQQKCTQACCSNTERHVNEARTSSERYDRAYTSIDITWSGRKHLSSNNSADGRIAKLLLVEALDVRSGNACFQTAVSRKRQVSGHGFQFKILSTQSPLQVLEVCKGNFREPCTYNNDSIYSQI